MIFYDRLITYKGEKMEINYCTKCGSKIDHITNYCLNCGISYDQTDRSRYVDVSGKKKEPKINWIKIFVLSSIIVVGAFLLVDKSEESNSPSNNSIPNEKIITNKNNIKDKYSSLNDDEKFGVVIDLAKKKDYKSANDLFMLINENKLERFQNRYEEISRILKYRVNPLQCFIGKWTSRIFEFKSVDLRWDYKFESTLTIYEDGTYVEKSSNENFQTNETRKGRWYNYNNNEYQFLLIPDILSYELSAIFDLPSEASNTYRIGYVFEMEKEQTNFLIYELVTYHLNLIGIKYNDELIPKNSKQINILYTDIK